MYFLTEQTKAQLNNLRDKNKKSIRQALVEENMKELKEKAQSEVKDENEFELMLNYTEEYLINELKVMEENKRIPIEIAKSKNEHKEILEALTAYVCNENKRKFYFDQFDLKNKNFKTYFSYFKIDENYQGNYFEEEDCITICFEKKGKDKDKDQLYFENLRKFIEQDRMIFTVDIMKDHGLYEIHEEKVNVY